MNNTIKYSVDTDGIALLVIDLPDAYPDDVGIALGKITIGLGLFEFEL